ncbi:MAG TPA: hypothetical protein VHC67_10030 [Gaiellaceae bacterium]|nr:hypothetical protein [Gaiellaceae bacterium]
MVARILCDVSSGGFDERGDGATNAFGKSVAYSDQLKALHIVASAARRRRPNLNELGKATRRLWGEDESGSEPDGLSVNSNETPIGLGGYDRPIESVENTDEIAARYRENNDPEMFCAYCEKTFRSRDIAKAFAWFRAHDCDGEGVDIEDWHGKDNG